MFPTTTGEGGLSRSGRKRKAGKRYPSGDPVPDKRPDDKVRAGRQPHRRGLKDEDRLSDRAESPLGRLNLQGVVNDDQYQAGLHYATVVGRYRSVIGSPRSTSGSGRMTGCEGGCELLISLFGAEKVRCACLEAKRNYDAAYAAVLGARFKEPTHELASPLGIAIARARVGRGGIPQQDQRAAKAVARVAVHCEDLPREDIVHLIRGLRSLARHFGLTGGRRREYSGNAH